MTATLSGQTDHTGIDVYIPGTSYIVKTDSNGALTLSNIPAGTWDLRIEKDGYVFRDLENVVVASNATTDVGAVVLIIDIGVDGQIIINGGQGYSIDENLEITIQHTTGATLYKISESETFLNSRWIPIADTVAYEMTDSSPGLHTIYAMFANANGLQSSPVSKNIKVIDTPTIISLGVNMYLEDNECFYGSVQVGNNAPIRKLFNNQNSLYISFYVAGEPSSTWFYENTTEYPNKYRYAINGEDISAKEWSDINVKSWHAGDATTGVGDLFEIILIPIDNEIDYDQASVQISVQLKNIVGESSIVTNDFIIQKNLSQSLFSNCSDVN